jgi:two-component system, cell cycle response regulator DivK
MQERQAPLVLVVDDNEDARFLESEFLDYGGFKVEEARDGEEAVQKAVELSPTIILLDLAMPHVDGFEAARDIPIIAVTSYVLPEWRLKARQAGCGLVIQKPVHPRELLAEIRRALDEGPATID